MRVVGVNVHPVKGTAIRPVTSVAVRDTGFVGDREWMVVDQAGTLVSARQEPRLFTIAADTPATDPRLEAPLRLRAPGMPDLVLDAAAGAIVPVSVFTTHLQATDEGPVPARWLESALGRPDLRLVRCDAPRRRVVEHDGITAHSRFQDSWPVTLGSMASLARLNQLIAQDAHERGEPAPGTIGIQRFRPNLVIDGEVPFEEDRWTVVQIGAARFQVVKPVSRCAMAMLDPLTLAKGPEPIRTLARHRAPERKTLFCSHLLPMDDAELNLGDPVSVVQVSPPTTA